MREPVWLSRVVLDALHLDQVREHGGMPGVRDENVLESALSRPKHKWNYEQQADLATLAAAYGYGLARNHPYKDGNKRAAFLAMYVFLGLNGLELDAPENDVVEIMIALAAGEYYETKLAEWVREKLVRI